MNRIVKIVLPIIILISEVYAQTNPNAGYAGSFLRMGLGARALGMGNTGTALASDGFASYYNPAGLPYLERRHISVTYYFLSLDRQFHYAGISIPIEPTAGVSVSWIHAGVDDIQGRTFTGEPDETYETGEDVIYLSFANSFHPRLSFGLNFKIHQNNLLEMKGKGLGFDFGVMLKPIDLFTIGVQFKDISSSYTWNTQELFEHGSNYTDEFPQILKVGVALEPSENFVISGDLEASDQESYRVHFGGEYKYAEMFYLRAGMSDIYPTFGAGLAYGFLGDADTHLDYCMFTGVAGEGVTHIFSWEFLF